MAPKIDKAQRRAEEQAAIATDAIIQATRQLAYIEPTVSRVVRQAIQQARRDALDEAAKAQCMYCNDPGWEPMSNSGYHQCNTPGPNMTRCGATKIHALRRELDARAAQIEEGE